MTSAYKQSATASRCREVCYAVSSMAGLEAVVYSPGFAEWAGTREGAVIPETGSDLQWSCSSSEMVEDTGVEARIFSSEGISYLELCSPEPRECLIIGPVCISGFDEGEKERGDLKSRPGLKIPVKSLSEIRSISACCASMIQSSWVNYAEAGNSLIAGEDVKADVCTDSGYAGPAEDPRKRLKKYSQTLETAIESAKLGFWDWDIVHGRVFFNDILKDMMNLDVQGNEVEEEMFSGLIEGNDRDSFLNKMRSHWRGETSSFVHEFRFQNSSGEQRWISSFGRVIETGRSARASRMLGFNRDITETKTAQLEIIEAKNRAEESDRLKSAFLANMSHEIRTPLNAIIGFSRLLSRVDLDLTTIKKYNDIIKLNSEQLMRIVSDILDISKIENGQLELSYQDVDIYYFLKEQFALLESLIHQSGKSSLKIEVRYPGENKLFSTDPVRLNQIMNNLISNAVKFTESGSITIGCSECRDKYIEFYVEDSGLGIEEQDREIIFERFRQVDDSYTRNYGGTGLGLAISKKLANMMKGDITVESGTEKGSVFYLRMPACSGREGASDVRDTQPRPRPQGGKKTVLLADDIWHIHDYLKAILKSSRYSIVSAYNGEEAYRIVRDNQNVDLVLMDIQMPVMNGITSMNRIRELRPDLPVVAFTAHAMVGDRVKYMKQGFSEYLSKPVDVTRLNSLLDNFLG